jgi:hypothetical protein
MDAADASLLAQRAEDGLRGGSEAIMPNERIS